MIDPDPQITPTARIGVIGDTHGYLDSAVLGLFAGVDHIIHCGDIGDPAILAELETVGPVTAVAGNLDHGDWADRLPAEVSGEVAGIRLVVAHKRKRLMKRFAAGKLASAMSGRLRTSCSSDMSTNRASSGSTLPVPQSRFSDVAV